MWDTWLDCRDKICQRVMSGYKTACTFEGFTGADIILTPQISSKITSDTIQSHLDNGAMMLQVKHSRDFDASVIDQRLFESLLRMNTWDSYQHQNGLLITGDFQTVDGHLYIDGARSRISESSYIGALKSWVIRGGVVYPIIKVERLQHFLDLLGAEMFVKDPFIQSATRKPRKKFKPAKVFKKGASLRQRVRAMTGEIDEYDLRHLLVNIDGISNKHINEIWPMLRVKNIEGFKNFALSDDILKVKGIGPKTVSKIRKQLGY